MLHLLQPFPASNLKASSHWSKCDDARAQSEVSSDWPALIAAGIAVRLLRERHPAERPSSFKWNIFAEAICELRNSLFEYSQLSVEAIRVLPNPNGCA